MKLSLVITLLNEQDNIQPLLSRVYEALDGMKYEVILVDDGSTDDTVKQIRQYANEHVNLIIFKKNYGQTTAMAAGIDYATGEYIITLDGDLQNDPQDIPAMVEKLVLGDWDLVAGNRKKRQDGFIWRKLPSKLANQMIRFLSGVHIADYGCTLKVFKKEVAKDLGLYGELHRFIPILAKLNGARITEMEVRHHPRIHGESKYGIGRTLKVISDLILMLFYQKYFRRPIHLFGGIGIISFTAGGLINSYLLLQKILGADIWGRPILILGVMLLLMGVQFITFGLIAELMMRVYYESQNKKTYLVKDVFVGKANSAQKAQAII